MRTIKNIRTIKIAENFSLDLHSHLIDRGLGILGMRGSGKSWTSGVVAEELATVGIPFIAIDLMGEYKTLREKFPVLIIALGSPKYADLKNLSEDQAAIIAERVVKAGISVVLDLKFGTMLQRYAFLAKFLEGLYHTEEKLMRPYVLIIDEAHRITPEKGVIKLREVREVQGKVEYWVYEIGATGRHYGIGFIAVARRTAEISKMTLTQCELKIVHKVVDPVDLDRLREYGLPSELLKRVKRFKAGDAVVIGLEEPKIVHVKARVCSHGARTPLAKPVETPDLAKAIQTLSEVIRAPPKPKPPVPEELTERLKHLTELKNRYERQIKDLSSERKDLLSRVETYKGELDAATNEINKLNLRIRELEPKAAITDEERAKWASKIRDLKKQLAEAVELEGRFEQIREVWGNLKDFLIEAGTVLGLELIPSDISEIMQERDRYRAELETYKREEELRRELFRTTLGDPLIKSWIRDAERFLFSLKREGAAGSVLLTSVLRMDPEIAFFPEDIESGYTEGTNRKYFRRYASKGLLWQVQSKGRTAFRNRFHQWVTEQVRKIKPGAPDGAIDEIVDRLKRSVIGG